MRASQLLVLFVVLSACASRAPVIDPDSGPGMTDVGGAWTDGGLALGDGGSEQEDGAGLDASVLGPACDPGTFTTRCVEGIQTRCLGGHETSIACPNGNSVCYERMCVAGIGCGSGLPACSADGAAALSCITDASGATYEQYSSCGHDRTCRPYAADPTQAECVSIHSCGTHAAEDLWCEDGRLFRCLADGTASMQPCIPPAVCRPSPLRSGVASCVAPDAVACDPGAFPDRCLDPLLVELCDENEGLVVTSQCFAPRACCAGRSDYDRSNPCCLS